MAGTPAHPGRTYAVTLDLAATDHVVPAGHRLALIVAGTDKDLIDPPADTPTLTVDLSRIVGTRTVRRRHRRVRRGHRRYGDRRPPPPAPLDGVTAPHTTHRVPKGAR
ncbi:hypothetical protein LV779_27795 [Streptomyces thinghirensis]|nr:hypothetical protein [Streptomyces thinghirensis]